MKKFTALIGEYNPTLKPQVATNAAIEDSAARSAIDVDADWVSTDEIDSALFERYSGIWVIPGSPKRISTGHYGLFGRRARTAFRAWARSG